MTFREQPSDGVITLLYKYVINIYLLPGHMLITPGDNQLRITYSVRLLLLAHEPNKARIIRRL